MDAAIELREAATKEDQEAVLDGYLNFIKEAIDLKLEIAKFMEKTPNTVEAEKHGSLGIIIIVTF